MGINRQLVKVGMAVTATVGALLFAVPGDAQAATPRTAQVAAACSPGALCMYTDTNMSGPTASVSASAIPQPDLRVWGMNDNISSICNYLGRTVKFFEHSNYGGGLFSVTSGACVNLTGVINDAVSSVAWE